MQKSYGSPLLALMNGYGFERLSIDLIEEYPCHSKIELGAREGYWIRQIGTFNEVIQGRTKKEWTQDNKAKRKEQNTNNPKYKAKKVC